MRARAAASHGVVRGLLLAAGVAGMTDAAAQSRWMHSLAVPAEVEYDSNPSMAPGRSPGSTFWLRLMPHLATKYVHGNEEFSAEATLTAEKSSNTEVAQDRLDPRLRAAWRHQDALNTTELAALVDQSAFRDLDLRRQVPLGVDGTRTLYAILGNWTRDLDAVSALNAEFRQEWERTDVGITPDFSRTTVLARYKRARDERTSWYTSVNAQDFRPDGTTVAAGVPVVAQRSTVAGALLGLDRQVTEGLRVDVSAGPVRFVRPDSRSDWQGGVTAQYKGLRWEGALDLLRTPSVDAATGLVVTEEVRMRVRYDLDPVTHLEAETVAAREKAAGSSRTLAGVAWVRQLSPSWQFTVKGSVQRQAAPEGTARSNRIGVALVYSAPDL